MGKSAPKVPKAPDPVATAEAQAKANQVTQITPQGNLIYGTYENGVFTPAAGHTAMQIEESPFQQQLREGGQGISLGLLESLQQGGAGNLSGVRTAADIEAGLMPMETDLTGASERASQAVYQQAVNRMQPQFERARGQLEQRLADQGIPMGSDAYQEEMNRFEQQQADQLNQLSLQAVQAGSAEQDRLARLQAALRGQQYNEQAGLNTLESQARATQFGELGSLLGFSQPFQQYNPVGVDVAGIANSGYQNQMARYGAQSAGQAGTMGALGSLVGAGLGFGSGTGSLFGYKLW